MTECYLPSLSYLPILLVCSLTMFHFYDHNFSKKKTEFHFFFAVFKINLKVLSMD